MKENVITGMFVLMQDAVSVGDVVSVAGSSGLVEQISIRSIRLRDQSGTVIIIPFSEVTTVKNMTKDYSFAVFSIGIAYREDVDEVIAVVTALGDELRADPAYAPRILEPIEILGLDEFADSARHREGQDQDQANSAMGRDARIQPPDEAALR